MWPTIILPFHFVHRRYFISSKKSEVRGDIHGVNVCRGALPFLHLLFADAWFLFCKADDYEITILKEILDKYGDVLGQIINYHKFEIFFSTNIQQPQRQWIFSFLGVSETIGSNKYLGLPSIKGKRKKYFWFCQGLYLELH